MRGFDNQQRAIAVLDIGEVASAPTSRPTVSVTRWRLRPLTFLPASYLRGAPLSAVLTDRLSTTPAEGLFTTDRLAHLPDE
jgi:hypothetical protein